MTVPQSTTTDCGQQGLHSSRNAAAANLHPDEPCKTIALMDPGEQIDNKSGIVYKGKGRLTAYNVRCGQTAQALYIDASSSSLKNNDPASVSLGCASAEDGRSIGRYHGTLYMCSMHPRVTIQPRDEPLSSPSIYCMLSAAGWPRDVGMQTGPCSRYRLKSWETCIPRLHIQIVHERDRHAKNRKNAKSKKPTAGIEPTIFR